MHDIVWLTKRRWVCAVSLYSRPINYQGPATQGLRDLEGLSMNIRPCGGTLHYRHFRSAIHIAKETTSSRGTGIISSLNTPRSPSAPLLAPAAVSLTSDLSDFSPSSPLSPLSLPCSIPGVYAPPRRKRTGLLHRAPHPTPRPQQQQ